MEQELVGTYPTYPKRCSNLEGTLEEKKRESTKYLKAITQFLITRSMVGDSVYFSLY
uniref:Uncharacterized protein n=1 Tax=Rhizophora mucronata TaxID=61149 RepID=A0A2P2NY11_RHIMU